jgi:hypothetical protein
MMIGFKEWALVCEELGSGRQSIILRKGGIAEGREGFRFQHPQFLLMPTLFHEQVSKLKVPADTVLPKLKDGLHTLSHMARVEWTRDLTDWEQIRRLDGFHIWNERVIRERYEYDAKQGVSLAFVRVYALRDSVSFPDEPRFGGCRSWVNLPEIPATGHALPVLDDSAHREVEASVLAALEG